MSFSTYSMISYSRAGICITIYIYQNTTAIILSLHSLTPSLTCYPLPPSFLLLSSALHLETISVGADCFHPRSTACWPPLAAAVSAVSVVHACWAHRTRTSASTRSNCRTLGGTFFDRNTAATTTSPFANGRRRRCARAVPKGRLCVDSDLPLLGQCFRPCGGYGCRSS